MAKLCIYAPAHGFAFGDLIYVSWLDDYFYAVNVDTITDGLVNDTMDANSLYISTLSTIADDDPITSLVEYTTTITDGYIRKSALEGSTEITGLSHLEGETVRVVSGQTDYGTAVVASGKIDLGVVVSTNRTIGLPYKLRIKTMRLSVPMQGNTLQTRIKRVNEITTRYIKTLGGEHGQEIKGTKYLTDMNTTFSKESQDTTSLVKGGFDDDCYITIESDDPFPMTILGTVVSFEVYEEK